MPNWSKIFSKLGNAAGDAASFAVPAGIALGGTALAGGNPMGGMALMSALGAGAGGFQANEQGERARKMQLAQKKNDSMANLINQLSSKGGYQAQQAAVPKPGFMEQLAGGAQTGIQAYQMADMAQQAAKTRGLQNRAAELQIGNAEQQMQRQLGAGAADAGGNVQANVTGSYNAKSPVGSQRTMPLMKTAPPPAVAGGFATRSMEIQKETAAARQAAEDRVLKQLDTMSQITARQEASRVSAAGLDLSTKRFGMDETRLGMDQTRLGLDLDSSARDQDRFTMEQERFGKEMQRFESDLLAAQKEEMRRLTATELAASDRILKAEPQISQAGEVATNYGKVKGLAADLLSEDSKTRGAGQVTLLNVYNRGFVDVGVAVRKEDQDLMREAQSTWDGLMSRVQAMKTGENFSPNLIRQIEASADQLYTVYVNSLMANVQGRLDASPGIGEAEKTRIQRFLLMPLLMIPPGSNGPTLE